MLQCHHVMWPGLTSHPYSVYTCRPTPLHTDCTQWLSIRHPAHISTDPEATSRDCLRGSWAEAVAIQNQSLWQESRSSKIPGEIVPGMLFLVPYTNSYELANAVWRPFHLWIQAYTAQILGSFIKDCLPLWALHFSRHVIFAPITGHGLTIAALPYLLPISVCFLLRVGVWMRVWVAFIFSSWQCCHECFYSGMVKVLKYFY